MQMCRMRRISPARRADFVSFFPCKMRVLCKMCRARSRRAGQFLNANVQINVQDPPNFARARRPDFVLGARERARCARLPASAAQCRSSEMQEMRDVARRPARKGGARKDGARAKACGAKGGATRGGMRCRDATRRRGRGRAGLPWIGSGAGRGYLQIRGLPRVAARVGPVLEIRGPLLAAAWLLADQKRVS